MKELAFLLSSVCSSPTPSYYDICKSISDTIYVRVISTREQGVISLEVKLARRYTAERQRCCCCCKKRNLSKSITRPMLQYYKWRQQYWQRQSEADEWDSWISPFFECFSSQLVWPLQFFFRHPLTGQSCRRGQLSNQLAIVWSFTNKLWTGSYPIFLWSLWPASYRFHYLNYYEPTITSALRAATQNRSKAPDATTKTTFITNYE